MTDITKDYEARILAYALGEVSFASLTDSGLDRACEQLDRTLTAARRELLRRQRRHTAKQAGRTAERGGE